MKKRHKDTGEHLPERQALPFFIRRSPAGLRLFCCADAAERRKTVRFKPLDGLQWRHREERRE